MFIITEIYIYLKKIKKTERVKIGGNSYHSYRGGLIDSFLDLVHILAPIAQEAPEKK